MQTIISPDGARIAYWRSGQGPALLLVHGATADHTTTWRFVLPRLESQYTVYTMDRCGRGGSDSPPYELQNAQGVARALTGARVSLLTGQQHAAMHTAPELFLSPVMSFLDQ